MEITRSSASSEVQRCPFCHSSVAAEEEQVACKQCLARHHRACWEEAQRCASCAAASPLVAPGDVVASVPAGQDDEDEVRRAASRLFEEEAPASFGRPLVYYLLFPLTLGFFTYIAPVAQLEKHILQNRRAARPPRPRAEDVARKIEEASTRALAVPGWVGALTIFSALGAAAALVFGIFLQLEEPRGIPPGAVLLIQGILWTLSFIAANAIREGVKSHEHYQLYAKLVSAAVAPDAVKSDLQARREAWRSRRNKDILVSALGAVPFAGVFFLPLLALRARGALDLSRVARGGGREAPLLQGRGLRRGGASPRGRAVLGQCAPSHGDHAVERELGRAALPLLPLERQRRGGAGRLQAVPRAAPPGLLG
jgi:hypothetical protein